MLLVGFNGMHVGKLNFTSVYVHVHRTLSW